MSERILIVDHESATLAARLVPQESVVVRPASPGKTSLLMFALAAYALPVPTPVGLTRDDRPYGKKARRAMRGGRHE